MKRKKRLLILLLLLVLPMSFYTIKSKLDNNNKNNEQSVNNPNSLIAKAANTSGYYICDNKCVLKQSGDSIDDCNEQNYGTSDNCNKAITTTKPTPKTIQLNLDEADTECNTLGNNYYKTNNSCIYETLQTTGNLPTLTKTGYTLKGWVSGSSTSECESGTIVTKYYTPISLEYTACWAANTTTQTTETATPVKEKPVVTSIVEYDSFESPDNIRYVSSDSALYSGTYEVLCGDEVTVEKCEKLTDTNTNPICTISSINGVKLNVETKVYRQKLVSEWNDLSTECQNHTRYTNTSTTKYTKASEVGTKIQETIPCKSKIIISGKLTEACNITDTNGTQYCKSTYNGETVYINRDNLGISSNPVCQETEKEKCTSSEPLTNVDENIQSFKICYEAKNGEITKEDINNYYSCKETYSKKVLELKENTCETVTNGTCYKQYDVSCTPVQRPSVGITGSLAINGYGTITIKGYDKGNGISAYIISETNKASGNSNWQQFRDNSYQAIEEHTTGIYFGWVKDKNDNISSVMYARIIDNDMSTTASSLEIKDETNNIINMNSFDNTTAYETGVIDSKYLRLNNPLKNNTTLAGFNSLSMGYKVTVDSPTITVFATLTSTDSSYVEGYEPRTVNLEYGENTILIKIKNKDGKIRTYTVLATRLDNRESNNLLSSLKVSKGKISFDPYVTNYDIEVSKNASEVNINATLDSTNSSFVEGYAPRTVKLSNDITSAIIKTISDAGITRSYVLTFIKKGTNTTENSINSVKLDTLTIEGTNLQFNKDIYEYTVSVDYQRDNLKIFAFPESENAKVSIEGDRNLAVGPNNLEIIVQNGSKIKKYSITVIRKEAGLAISDSTKLEMLSVKDYNINFNPEVLDYVVKIKQEKSLVIVATPESNRSEVYMYGNNDLTGFSTVRIKVIAENGETSIYSIDIQKEAYNKTLEITAAVVGGVVLLGAAIIIIVSKKRKKMKAYLGK